MGKYCPYDRSQATSSLKTAQTFFSLPCLYSGYPAFAIQRRPTPSLNRVRVLQDR